MDILIGGFVAILSGVVLSYLNHRWSVEKEHKQWQRQQTLEFEKLSREQQKQNREQLIDAYNNSLFYLSKFLVERAPYYHEPEEEDTREYQEKYETCKNRLNGHFLETQRYLWVLFINLKNVNDTDMQEFENKFKEFIEDRDRDTAEDLQSMVIRFATQDDRLQPKEFSPKSINLLNS